MILKKFTRFTAIFIAALVFFSCLKPDDVRIVEVEQLGLETMTKPIITLKVRNDSRKNIQVITGKFTLNTPSGKIGEVMLTDVITVPKRSETSITLPIRIRISNPLAAASIISGNGLNTDRLFITGETQVKAGAAKKKFTFENTPVSRFLSIFE